MFVIENHFVDSSQDHGIIHVNTSPTKRLICFKDGRKKHYFYLGFPKMRMYLGYRLSDGKKSSLMHSESSKIVAYNTKKKPVYLPLSNFDEFHDFCMPEFSLKLQNHEVGKIDTINFSKKAIDLFFSSAFTGDTYNGLIHAYDCDYFSDEHVELLNKWQSNTKANKKFRFKNSDFIYDQFDWFWEAIIRNH